MRIAACAVLAVGVAFGRSAGAGTVYNAAGDFSATNNPNGVWSFGSSSTLGGAFTLSTFSGNVAGLDYWSATPTIGHLAAYLNPTGSTILWATVVVEAHQLVVHPGQLGEYAITRFTAPTSGTYAFSAGFIGQDRVLGTTTDVHLLLNNAALFSGAVAGFHSTAASGGFVMSLAAGDTLDAAVGFGSNRNYYGDSTGLAFSVESIPLPSGAGLGGVGLSLIMLRRRRGLTSAPVRGSGGLGPPVSAPGIPASVWFWPEDRSRSKE